MGVSCSSGGEIIPKSSIVEAVASSESVDVAILSSSPPTSIINNNNNRIITSSSCTETQSPSSTDCSLEVPVVVVMTPKNLNVQQQRKQQHDESLYSSGTVSLAEFGTIHTTNDRESAATGTCSSMVDIVTGSTISTTATAFAAAAHCSFGDSVDSRLPSRRQSQACGSLADDDESQQQQTQIRRRRSTFTDKPFSIAVPSTSLLIPKRASSKSDSKSLSYLDQARGARDDGDDEDGSSSPSPLTSLRSTSNSRSPTFATSATHARQPSEENLMHNSNRALPLYPPISVSEKISETSQRGLEVSAISHLYLADSHSQNTNSQPSLPSVTYPMYSNNSTIVPTSPTERSTLLPPLSHTTPTSTTNPHTTTTTTVTTSSQQKHHHTSVLAVSPLTSYHGTPTTPSIEQLRSRSVSSAKKAGSRLFDALQSGGSSCITSGNATPRPIRPLARMGDDRGDAFGDGYMAVVQDVDVNTRQFRDVRLPSLPADANHTDDEAMSSLHSGSFISSTLSTSTSSRRIKRRGGTGMVTPGTPARPLIHPNNLEKTDTKGIFFTNDDDINTHETQLAETVIEVSYVDDSICNGSSVAGSSMPWVVVPPSMGVLCPSGSLSKSTGDAPTPLNQSEMRCSANSTNPEEDDDDDDDPLVTKAVVCIRYRDAQEEPPVPATTRG